MVLASLLVACASTLALPPAARADDQHAKVSIDPRPSRRSVLLNAKPAGALRLDVNLVLVPVLVTDLYDRPVQGLHKEDFRLFEDGAEQSISQFFSDDSPISIGVVFDASTSMRTKISQTRQAVSDFLRMSTPGDEFFLLKFSDHPETVHGFTTNTAEIEDSVQSIQPGGWTSLFDAIYVAIHHMRHAAHSRKVLLVLSDGADNNSRYTESELRRLVKESDVRIFGISILDRAASLERISEESGGRTYRVKDLDELSELAANVSIDMHMQYVLGYSPALNQNDGKYRKIKVELTQQTEGPRLRTSWKRGYYGPAQ